MSNDDKKKNNDPDVLASVNIMKNEEGRGFIYRHLQSCGVFESIFNIDPLQHSYNSGMRDGGLTLNRKVKESAPENYIKMITENIDG